MERIYLSGSDEVSRAGNSISIAAKDMLRAANLFNSSICMMQQQIDRLESLLNRAINELPQGN